MSLRLRLVLATVLIGGVGLICMNVAVYRFVHDNLSDRLDAQVQEVNARFGVARFLDVIGRINDPLTSPPFGGDGPGSRSRSRATAQATGGPDRTLSFGEIYTEVRDPEGGRIGEARIFSVDGASTLTLDLPDPLPPATITGTAFTVNGRGGSASKYRALYRVETLPDGRTYRVLTALPASELYETLERLRTIQIIATLSVLAAVASGAWLLARWSLRPLRRIEAAAETIADGDLSHPIGGDGGRTEIGRLGGSLNRMMSQIRNAFAEREASQAQLRRFVADASHELRTPLAAMQGYAQLHFRTRAGRDAETDRVFNRMEDASARMAHVVEDLLVLANEEASTSAPEPVELDVVLSAVAHDARVIAPGRSISLIAPESAAVIADRHALHRAFANLVDNAIRHTPADTPIEIVLSGDDHHASVSITDHGPGIAADHLPHLFEPFYRVDPSRSRHTGGAGLGLAIVAQTVRAAGGSIAVRSTLGEGVTFIVDLPLAGTPAAGGTTVSAPSMV